MEQYGSQVTYNLETVLQQNIKNADFYRNDCAKLTTWSAVIDQIYYQVDYVEPWLAGNARGPSTAFCLLYRLCDLKPTEEEVRATINHEDSVYIRAVGFLYLRYVADPRKLWGWLGPYCDDKEEIQPSGPNGPLVTVGDFVRDLLLEQYYYETIFPRIPKKVEDDIQAALRGRGLPTKGKGNGGCGGPDRRGGDDGNRRPASVKASLSVAFGQRAPNRAGTRKAAGDGRAGGGGGVGGGGGSLRDRSRDPSREPAADGERRGGGAADRSYAGRSRSGSRERPRDRYNGYDSRDRDRDRERGYDSRDRERDRSARDYDSRRGDRQQYDRGSGYGRDRRDYDRRDPYDRNSSRDEPSSTRHRRSSRSRSRSPGRSRGGGGGRDASDVFKDRAGGAGAAAAGGGDVRSRYGDASGKLDLGPAGGGSGKRSADEVFRLGTRTYR